MKTCRSCNETKPVAEYNVRKGLRAGELLPMCRPCLREYGRRYRAANNDRMRSYALKSGLKFYGVTLDEYAALLDRQGNRCAICRSDRPGHTRMRRFVVDHDHRTKIVRGLLCENCNRGLGMYQDDAARLRAAADYLDGFK